MEIDCCLRGKNVSKGKLVLAKKEIPKWDRTVMVLGLRRFGGGGRGSLKKRQNKKSIRCATFSSKEGTAKERGGKINHKKKHQRREGERSRKKAAKCKFCENTKKRLTQMPYIRDPTTGNNRLNTKNRN